MKGYNRMRIIDSLATKLARSIRVNYQDAASEKSLKYALILLINTIITISIIFIICLFTHHLFEGFIVVTYFFVLRYISGGAHLYTSEACTMTSIIILTSIAHLHFNYWNYGFIINTVAVIVFCIYAPEGINQKVSKINPKYYPLLKIISILMVSSNFIFHSFMLSVLCITQAFFLTKPAYKLIDFMKGGVDIEADHS